MTYVLTIYIFFTFNVVPMQKLVLDNATCRAEATRIVSEIGLPPHIFMRVECTPLTRNISA